MCRMSDWVSRGKGGTASYPFPFRYIGETHADQKVVTEVFRLFILFINIYYFCI